jgi:hypothetical protein
MHVDSGRCRSRRARRTGSMAGATPAATWGLRQDARHFHFAPNAVAVKLSLWKSPRRYSAPIAGSPLNSWLIRAWPSNGSRQIAKYVAGRLKCLRNVNQERS